MLLAILGLRRRPAATLVAALSVCVAIAAVGCPRASPVAPPETPNSTKLQRPLRLLVVDDALLAAAIEREWKASARGELEISQAKASDLAETKRLAADVVIYPSALLGDFAERHLIAEFPSSALDSEAFAHGDIFPLLRRRECTWGKKVYAVPFGSPQLFLLYRKDVLEKLHRPPPATWNEYQELLLLTAGWVAEESGRKATAEPIAEGWGAKLFLARAASYARHPNQYSALFDYQTMEPLVATPPFVRALEELVAAQQSSPHTVALTPQSCAQAMLNGQCAMAIAWPMRNPAPALNQPAEFPLGCAELPGAQQVYNFQMQTWSDTGEPARVPLLGSSGRLGSITSSARHTRSAAEALLWLAGKEKGAVFAAQSPDCTLSRSSQVPQASRFVSEHFDSTLAGDYGAALAAANDRPLSLETPRIPGHDDYLAALDAAVQSAIAQEKSPADALAAAAQTWREITQHHGIERQRAAYLRSLGLEP